MRKSNGWDESLEPLFCASCRSRRCAEIVVTYDAILSRAALIQSLEMA